MIINAKIENWLGEAKKNLKLQMPKLIEFYTELNSMYEGTINVRLDGPITIDPYLTTPLIKWKTDHQSETFDITPCIFKLNDKEYNAVIYQPSLSPHRKDATKLEIITTFIEEVKKDILCKVSIESKYIKETK